MKVVLCLLKRMLRMLRLLEVGKGGWKGKETNICLKWQLENWSYVVLKILHKQSSKTDAELLTVILCSIRYDPKHSTSQKINKKTQNNFKSVLMHTTCLYLPKKEELWVGKAGSDAGQLTLHHKQLQMRSSFRVITLSCLLQTKLHRPAWKQSGLILFIH